ncbi:MAG: hypothetical protein SFW36_05060 [Leptolyngbyaceae cyanobacterium bins.59]|nr:hypothetical protein [Leptolyngbyaceae cyanobacterium bins.59]
MDTPVQPPTTLFLVPLNPLPTASGLSESDRIFLYQVLTLLLEALSHPELIPQQDLYHCVTYLLETAEPAPTAIPHSISQSWYVQDYGNRLGVRSVQKLHPFKCLVVNVLTAYQTLIEPPHPQRTHEMQRLGLQVCIQLLIRILNRSPKEVS